MIDADLKKWLSYDTGPSDAYTNMAIDEVLLNRIQGGEERPVLRFYTWSSPAISVGYFQNIRKEFDLELCRERHWDLVRRLTGGRAVFHDHELTYSLLVPMHFPDLPGNIRESYRYLSQGFLLGLRELGAEAELVSLQNTKGGPRKSSAKSPDCFASPSRHEISVGGKKIMGSAQRRIASGILQQGSIMISTRRFHEFYEVFLKNTDKIERDIRPGSTMTSLHEALQRDIPLNVIKKAILCGFEKALGVRFVDQELTKDEKIEANGLVFSRYKRSDWNLSRKAPVFKEKT